MTSQSPSQPATAPLSGSEITDHLPAEQWVAELLYHCIRSHEERVRELQASTPEYDPKPAYRAIETSGALLDRILGNAGLVGMKRDLTFAYWDRGLQSDAIKAVRSGFAEKVRADGESWHILREIFGHFVMAQHESTSGLALYGGASLCLHVAHEAGLDPNDLIREMAARDGKAAGSAK